MVRHIHDGVDERHFVSFDIYFLLIRDTTTCAYSNA